MLYPRIFKDAFMDARDLQIGRTYTVPDCRGLGLAKVAVQTVLKSSFLRDGYYWYLVEPTNENSIRVAKANGFEIVGSAHQTKFLGQQKLGKITVNAPTNINLQAQT